MHCVQQQRQTEAASFVVLVDTDSLADAAAAAAAAAVTAGDDASDNVCDRYEWLHCRQKPTKISTKQLDKVYACVYDGQTIKAHRQIRN